MYNLIKQYFNDNTFNKEKIKDEPIYAVPIYNEVKVENISAKIEKTDIFEYLNINHKDAINFEDLKLYIIDADYNDEYIEEITVGNKSVNILKKLYLSSYPTFEKLINNIFCNIISNLNNYSPFFYENDILYYKKNNEWIIFKDDYEIVNLINVLINPLIQAFINTRKYFKQLLKINYYYETHFFNNSNSDLLMCLLCETIYNKKYIVTLIKKNLKELSCKNHCKYINDDKRCQNYLLFLQNEEKKNKQKNDDYYDNDTDDDDDDLY